MSARAVCVYQGSVFHRRHVPHDHSFVYDLSVFSVPLVGDEEAINQEIKKSGIKGRFFRKDYFGDHKINLAEAVLNKASELNSSKVSGEVTMIGQLRRWGPYFCPVNFYLIRQSDKKTDDEAFNYLLAEVTNTPWGEKHCYLVDLAQCNSHDKEFHVSPFNPMDMKYHWDVSLGNEQVKIRISCHRDELEFEAGFTLKKSTLSSQVPALMCSKIFFGIYFQALQLFLKKTPVYDHP